jgi:hypothetical protein
MGGSAMIWCAQQAGIFSECRLAASACGLDPGMGFLHTDPAIATVWRLI